MYFTLYGRVPEGFLKLRELLRVHLYSVFIGWFLFTCAPGVQVFIFNIYCIPALYRCNFIHRVVWALEQSPISFRWPWSIRPTWLATPSLTKTRHECWIKNAKHFVNSPNNNRLWTSTLLNCGRNWCNQCWHSIVWRLNARPGIEKKYMDTKRIQYTTHTLLL